MASLRARLAHKPPGYRFTIGRVLAIYGALMLALLLASLDQTIVATALPRIVSDLGGLTNYSWVFTGYVLATAVTVPLYGKLGDIYGRRQLYLVAIPLFLLGSALCGLSQNMWQLVAFRIVQGLGAGGLFALAQATIAVIVPPRDRGRYQGLIGSTFVAGSIAGPALGGLIVDNASWRWIFYVNIPVGLVALAVIAVAIPKRSPRHEHAVDYLGAALLAAGTTFLLLGLVWGGQQYPWASFEVLGALLAAVVFLGGIRLRGAARARADPAVRPVPNANGCGRGGRDRDLGDGDGRDDRLRAALRAGRDRHVGDLVGRRADAVLHRSRDHERDLRAVDLAKRPLPAECPRRAGRPRRRASSCSRAWTPRRRASRLRGTWSSRGSGSA